MDLALNNLQSLMYHKTKLANHASNQPTIVNKSCCSEFDSH